MTTPCNTRGWFAYSTLEVERLTSDRTADKRRAGSKSPDPDTAQTVAFFLRLPVILTKLFNVFSELRPPSDRYQLLDLLEKLYRCCDNFILTLRTNKCSSKVQSVDLGSDINELENGCEENTPSSVEFKKPTPKYEIDSMFQSISSAASSGTKNSAAQSTSLKTSLKRHDIITLEENTAISCDQRFKLMAEQSATEFARSGLEEIEQLQCPMDSAETYRNLFTTWFSGSEWRSMADLLSSSSSPTAAVQEVSSRIFGPVPEDASEKRVREIRRKRLTTHLTRGRAWDELVTTLGFGILFKNAWSLAKSKKHVIKDLISQLKHDQEKIDILRLLEKQMDALLEDGQTDPAAFRQALKDQALLGTSKHTSDISEEVVSLQKEMRLSAPGNMLLIKSTTKFRFDIETLDRLSGTEWFNDKLILLCLHLADKLPYVRVGFSMVTKPFERAAQVIAGWKNAEPNDRLVCFFPLFQHGDHFSLLEVNYRDNAIYHYDSLKKATHTEIKKACKHQFPGLQYVEQTAPHQLDHCSCGPLVVTSARYRMLGRAVIPGDVTLQNATAIRATAFSLIRTAWHDTVLVPVEQSTGRKRMSESIHQRQGKRQKTDHKPVQVEDLTI
ncbi:hypothetical protein GGR58DRAFT_514371 [Xylaria digitata]|nr:hypothetical protein GGR58DRAFT_514371 [Xylaria digitata]